MGILAVVVLGACVPSAPPPPSLPGLGSACTAREPSVPSSVSNTGPVPDTPLGDDALSPGAAAELIREDVASNQTRTADGSIPLVLVEEVDGEPEITTATASSTQDAGTIAADAAESAELVSVEVDSVATTATDDFFSPEQWSFDHTTFESAWATSTGADTLVAVIDTGVQMDHPDLRDQVVTGRQFLYAEGLRSGRRFDGVDANGHGTHVAGIVGAATNNDRGVAGTAPDTKIQPLRTLEACGGGWMSDVALAIDYARRSGADVINLSLGSFENSPAVALEIQQAVAEGVIVVASAGNDGRDWNRPSYPAALPQSVSVAAVRDVGAQVAHADYSTSGAYVDVAAPGSGVCSTWPTQKTFNQGGCRPGVTARYRYLNGTSMAAPHVSGVAALLKGVRSGCTATDFLDLVDSSSDLIPGTTAPQVGAGLVDPAEILTTATC